MTWRQPLQCTATASAQTPSSWLQTATARAASWQSTGKLHSCWARCPGCPLAASTLFALVLCPMPSILHMGCTCRRTGRLRTKRVARLVAVLCACACTWEGRPAVYHVGGSFRPAACARGAVLLSPEISNAVGCVVLCCAVPCCACVCAGVARCCSPQ